MTSNDKFYRVSVVLLEEMKPTETQIKICDTRENVINLTTIYGNILIERLGKQDIKFLVTAVEIIKGTEKYVKNSKIFEFSKAAVKYWMTELCDEIDSYIEKEMHLRK